ncbi:hypothetical protein [Saccharothrix lopnurensis]|uniref:Uncharacterized protein n=1 Tax=Saccharothrix lopnurensis TaxID=1670621 RepID=A0ABW1PCE8_9PSEU
MTPPRATSGRAGPADRVLFLSHADYVELKDRHPRLIKDDQVTVVPYPLLGKWVADERIRDVRASPNTVLMRDVRSGGYVPVESALTTLALAQAHVFTEVCQLLGATSLRTVESDREVGETAVTDRSTRDVSASLTPGVSAGWGSDTDFALGLRKEVRRDIEAGSTFAGGAPDIEGARAAEFDDVTRALGHLITLREFRTNPIRHYRAQVDFLSVAHKQVDLLLEFARGLSAVLPKRGELSLDVTLTNRFRWSTDTNRQQRFSIEVSFPDA